MKRHRPMVDYDTTDTERVGAGALATDFPIFGIDNPGVATGRAKVDKGPPALEVGDNLT